MSSAFDSTYQRLDPRTERYVPAASLGEKISSTWALMNSEVLGRSAADAWTDKLKDRRLQIEDLIGEKLDLISPMKRDLFGPDATLGFPIYDEPRDDYVLPNGQTIAQFTANNPDVPDEDGIWDLITTEKMEIRDRFADVARRSPGFTNVVGSLIGGFAASLRDPAILLSMTMGAGAGATVLRAAAIEAGLAVTAEAIIQPNIIRFQRALGDDVGLTDAVKNIAFIGGAAAVFGGTIRGVGLLGRRWIHPATKQTDELLVKLQEAEVPLDRQEQLAFDFLNEYNEINSRNPFKVNDPKSYPDHAAMLGRTQEAFDNYRSPVYDDILNGREGNALNPDMVADPATVRDFVNWKQREFGFVDDMDNVNKAAEFEANKGDVFKSPAVTQGAADLAFREAEKLDIDIPTMETIRDVVEITGSRKSKEILSEVLSNERVARFLKVCQIGG